MRHLALLTLTALLCACAAKQPPSLEDTLEQTSGTWRVINYWAQWCKPCIKEIPELNALAQEHKDITVLGVNYDGATGEQLAQQIAELGIAFSTLPSDPAPYLGMERPTVLPTTVILSPAGELSATLIGPQTAESLLNATRGE